MIKNGNGDITAAYKKYYQGCLTSGNIICALQQVDNFNYTVIHEYGHVFDSKSLNMGEVSLAEEGIRNIYTNENIAGQATTCQVPGGCAPRPGFLWGVEQHGWSGDANEEFADMFTGAILENNSIDAFYYKNLPNFLQQEGISRYVWSNNNVTAALLLAMQGK